MNIDMNINVNINAYIDLLSFSVETEIVKKPRAKVHKDKLLHI